MYIFIYMHLVCLVLFFCIFYLSMMYFFHMIWSHMITSKKNISECFSRPQVSAIGRRSWDADLSNFWVPGIQMVDQKRCYLRAWNMARFYILLEPVVPWWCLWNPCDYWVCLLRSAIFSLLAISESRGKVSPMLLNSKHGSPLFTKERPDYYALRWKRGKGWVVGSSTLQQFMELCHVLWAFNHGWRKNIDHGGE